MSTRKKGRDTMSGLTHIAGGLLIGSLSVYHANSTGNSLDEIATGAYLVGCMSGAIICDADEPNSLIGRTLWPFSLLFRIIHWVFRIIAAFLPKKSKLRRNFSDVSWAFAHRGLMHWPLMQLLFSAGLFVLVSIASRNLASIEAIDIINSTAVGLSTGLFSHLVYDLPSGTLPLLAPFSGKRFGLKLIESNGFLDKYIIRTLSLAGSAYLLIFK